MLLQKLQFIQCVSVVAFIPKCYASPIEQDINPGYTAPEENRSQNLTEIKPSNMLLLKEAYTSEYKKYENVVPLTMKPKRLLSLRGLGCKYQIRPKSKDARWMTTDMMDQLEGAHKVDDTSYVGIFVIIG
ncbi:hypothetical protein F4703DRAFT_1798899 [Phycomyces blakesleeanus]